MRSGEILPGEAYAVNLRSTGQRAPARFGEVFPLWKAIPRKYLGSGKWLVEFPDLQREFEIRSAAIREPWAEYGDVMLRQQAVDEEVQSMRLTWEQLEAGDPCPGCGRPYLDHVPRGLSFLHAVQAAERLVDQGEVPAGELSGTVKVALVVNRLADREGSNFVPNQRTQQALEIRRKDEQWCSEHVHRTDAPPGPWHGKEDGPVHCGACCPVPPLSPVQVERVTRILATRERVSGPEGSGRQPYVEG